jgi:peptide/nickel transport system substrate-binding protein
MAALAGVELPSGLGNHSEEKKRMRKIVLTGVGSVLLALLVAACGGSSSSGDTASLETGASVNAACEEEPVKGGNLVYARALETVGLNPWENHGNGDIFADEMIYAGLVRLNPEGGDEIQPALAESWDVSADGKTYTFHLRPGIKFSDGSPITAEDVKWSLDSFGDPEVNEIGAALAAGYAGTKILDPQTVQVKLTEPIAAFLYNIAIFPAVILPQEMVEKEGDAFWKHPVGAGPFKVKEFATGDHLTLERNLNYWESGKPYLDSVRFNFAVESNSRVLALKSGQAQIADFIPFSQVASLQNDPSLVVQTAVWPAWQALLLNNDVKPLSDLNVRTAMQYAVDREQINAAIFKGLGSIPNSLFGPLKFDDESIEPYEYDLAKAKEYMAKSKFPNGFSMSLKYPTGFDYAKQLTLLLQQEFAAIGIEVKLEEEAAATVFERWAAEEYEGLFTPVSSDIPVPDEYAGLYADPGSGTDGFFSGWSDPAITKKVLKFQRTLDEDARAKQWSQLQRELLEQSPSINIMNLPLINGHGVDVCGTAINSVGADRLEFTWLTEAAKS